MHIIEVFSWALFGALLATVQRRWLSTADRSHRMIVAVVSALLGGFTTRLTLPAWSDPVLSLLAAGVAAMVGLVLVEVVGRPPATRPI